jgi:mono/diheme cytochrome c family protein
VARRRAAWPALVAGAMLGMLAGAGAVWGLGQLNQAAPEEPGSRYERGRRTAERLGCFACHGPDGRSGTTNFLPELDEVPSWSRGTFKSYVQSEQEVTEWILEGIPARMKADPREEARVKQQLIRMPAYRDHVKGEALADLVHYVLAVSTLLPREEESAIAKGREVATRLGCLGCHGGEGRYRTPNPGSFKGYIPAWDSADYAELVESPEEFRQWVLQGAPERLRRNPVARYILERQLIRMPAYEKHLTAPELDQLLAYVTFVRSTAP